MAAGKHIHEPKPGVVPRGLMLGSRIAETDDDAQW
jgi:hypothetical protein